MRASGRARIDEATPRHPGYSAEKPESGPNHRIPIPERRAPAPLVPCENGGISAVLQATSDRTRHRIYAPREALCGIGRPRFAPDFYRKINPRAPLLGRPGLHFPAKRLISTAKIEKRMSLFEARPALTPAPCRLARHRSQDRCGRIQIQSSPPTEPANQDLSPPMLPSHACRRVSRNLTMTIAIRSRPVGPQPFPAQLSPH